MQASALGLQVRLQQFDHVVVCRFARQRGDFLGRAERVRVGGGQGGIVWRGLQQMQGSELGHQVHGLHFLGQHADRAKRTGLAQVEFATFLGGVHHDRDQRSCGIGLDDAHRFKAVHAGHHVVHEDGVGLVVQQILERFLGGCGFVHRDAVLDQLALEHQARRARVVYDQSASSAHGNSGVCVALCRLRVVFVFVVGIEGWSRTTLCY